MFWKKKNHNQSTDPLHLDYEPDRRTAFRVFPSSETPVVFCYENRTEPLHNLSAGGLAFFSAASLEKDQILEGDLYLPQAVTSIPIACRVRDVEGTGLVRASFEGISDQDREKIHQYVLDRQKKILAAPEDDSPEA